MKNIYKVAIGVVVALAVSVGAVHFGGQMLLENRLQQAKQDWEERRTSFAEESSAMAFGYMRQDGVELFFWENDEGIRFCGQHDLLTGVEEIYSDGVKYCFSPSKELTEEMDTAGIYDRYVAQITGKVTSFEEEAVAEETLFRKGWFEYSLPAYCSEKGTAVILTLYESCDNFVLPEDSFAHFCIDGDTYRFTYNVDHSENGADSAVECLFLSLGALEEDFLYWQGHDWSALEE